MPDLTAILIGIIIGIPIGGYVFYKIFDILVRR